ncbi:MAG: DUF7507 domain-containing protein, partial [bacterium]
MSYISRLLSPTGRNFFIRSNTFLGLFCSISLALSNGNAMATPFTETIPDGLGTQIPSTYPVIGGTMFVLEGANGNYYYQFVNPSTQFSGFSDTGTPAAYRGNPFQLGPSQALNCGTTSCSTYFGGSIVKLYVRLTVRDGDTCTGEFDENDITFRVNGYDVSNFTGPTSQETSVDGSIIYGTDTCFPNQTSSRTSTAWFTSTNSSLLNDILTVGSTTPTIHDLDGGGDNLWYFTDGNDASGSPEVAPGITIVKSASPTTYTNVGDTINYSFALENIGSVTINSIAISDPSIPASVSCPTTSLASAATTTCSASYSITQSDIDNGTFVNTATVTGTPTEGSLGPVTDSATITGPAASPSWTVTKSTVSIPVQAGDTLDYTFSVDNTGNISVSGITVADAKCAATPTLLSGDTNSNNILEPTETHIYGCTSIAVTQTEIDSGTVDNSVTVSGTPSRGSLSNATDSLSTATVPTYSLSLTKPAPANADND